MNTELRKAAEAAIEVLGNADPPASDWSDTVDRLLAALAAPRDELAAVPPSGHVRLPDGRDVRISNTGMEILRNMADGKPWNFAFPPYQPDANPVARAAVEGPKS